MFKVFLQGLLLGLAYVAPIGIQNLYIINSALKKSFLNSFVTALIVVFFDVSLALACFFGIGLVVEKYIILKKFLLLVGSMVVIFIGYKLIKSKPEIVQEKKVENSWKKVIVTCFFVTWINPQAIIDGSLLLGGYKASLPINSANYFILGVSTASLIWFSSMAMVTSIFKKVVSKKILRVINIICGLVIIIYGIKLGISFFKM